jgi:mannosyl-oligosaccharide alpha-1,2-mannosidase
VQQYLLLGGLEDVYRKLYMKTIAAIRKHMLYRPMTNDGRNILFSGSVTTFGNPEIDLKLSADVEHLTCFIGGMIGMSSKIFGLEGDLEIAKKLADGCVWAYESFPSGIMPEGATAMPCPNLEVCPWNETAYWEFLDPVSPAIREKQIEDYYAQKALQQQEAEEQEARLAAAKIAAQADFSVGVDADGSIPHDYDTTDPTKGSESLKKEKPASLLKRQTDTTKDSLKPAPEGSQPKPKADLVKADVVGLSEVKLTPEEMSYQQKTLETKAELDAIPIAGGHQSEKPLKALPIAPLTTDPWKPLSHEEFVQRKIKEQSLPPGFVSIKSRKYILR